MRLLSRGPQASLRRLALLSMASALALLLAGPAAAQSPPGAALSLASDPALIARTALDAERGTVVVGLLRGGKASYGAAYNPEPPTPPRALSSESAEQPMFEIGSVTKVFTGLLLAQAVERGDMKLDDNLGQLMAGKIKAPLSPAVASVTLRQLVTHTGCMPVMADGVTGGPALASQMRAFERQELYDALPRIKLLGAAPPCAGAYSNYGMALVGLLVADRYNTTWSELVRARITEPLGMNDTVILLGDKASRMAPAFAGDRRQSLLDMKAYAPIAALRSTAADMMVFSRAILAGASGPFGPAAVRLLTPLANYEGAEIGYAVMVRGAEGARRTYYHAGVTEGYRTLWLLAPDTGEAMILLSSNTRAPLQRVMLAIGKSRYPVPTVEVPVDADKLAEYRGEYRVTKSKSLDFTVRGGRLLVRESGRGYNPLKPIGTDRFTVGEIGAQVVFQREGGQVVGVTLSQGGAQVVGRRAREGALVD
ncbi:CubicO group peptidase, beta-lactamase class C family [Variovorax sp. PDC80]|uniref:serine hydrolase domain-containing protein n=1 Tax=Variovorax sp. PDC80 TaxID=1882827 RepID=UPI0008E99EE1|nr:serine hydrolase domain-containing protein [Variovorax sp. PDC80]SFP97708.1 CubicO group peptidase, beta-lactamase class C family [Variovorax sp. PDC80]